MHFTGKMRDAESNLDASFASRMGWRDDFDARYYSSQWGRFMIPDWDAKPAAVPYASFGNPQSLNLYAYVRNNPSTTLDPDGHCGEDLCIIEGGVSVYILGSALVAGTAAVLQTPAAQRSIDTFSSAASANLHANYEAAKAKITSWFSHSNKEGESAEGTVKEVTVDATKYPESAKHITDAQAAGYPDTVTVDRAGAAGRRAAATRGTPTSAGMDRDEYPPAVTKEGGRGSSVRPVPSSDNRGSGASIGSQIRGVQDGTQIKITVTNPDGSGSGIM